MGERKVLNKYYPPDFDPSKLPRNRRPKNEQIKVRMMLPMSIRCNTCGNYMYKGTKFNSRKEDVIGEREADEMGDAMKSLENRTLDSKREMDILAGLDEMKSMKSRHAIRSVDAMLEALQRTAAGKNQLVEEDEALMKSVFSRKSKELIKRIRDEDLEDDEFIVAPSNGNGETSEDHMKRRRMSEEVTAKATDILTKDSLYNTEKSQGSGTARPFHPFVKINVVKKSIAADKKKIEEENKSNTRSALQSLCKSYDSEY
ncbi:hypothetical protein K1719_034894 [Acacia pycnantha]|nr:hypothetical protein K1719_034894 [Acacia pycnantha]